MNAELLQGLIEEDFGYKSEGRNWGRAEEHSSLVVNEELQIWYWNSQGMGGNAYDYLIKVRGLSRKSAKEVIDLRNRIVGLSFTEEGEIVSKPYEKLVEFLWESGKKNREYWYHRCLKDSTIDRYQLGHFDGWYVIPLFVGDSFVNFQCRRDEPKRFIKYWYKHQKPVMINPDVLNLVDKVYITEGPVDSLLLNQEGMPSVSHTGGNGFWDDAWYPLFYRTKEVYYIADNDRAGKLAAIKVAKALGQDRVKIYNFDGKADKYDTVDYFRDGGNSSELRELVESDSKYLYEV